MKTKLVVLAFLLAMGGSAFGQQQVQPVAGVLTLSLAPGNNSFKVILSANVTSTVFTNPTPGTTATVIFTENATGGFTVTFGGNITATNCSVATAALAKTVCTFTYDASDNTWTAGGSGGGTSPSSLTTQPVQTNLLGYYKALPGETVASLKDYSGLNNNATGTVGTAPTIIANTGGLSCGGSGAVILPSALNSATTLQVLIATSVFSGTPRAPIFSNNNGSGTSGGVGFYVVGGATPGLPAYGLPIVGGDRVQTSGGNSGFIYAEARGAVGGGYSNVAMAMDTLDRVYINGIEDAPASAAYYGQLRSSASLNASPFQLCGSATGATQSVYYQGTIVSALFYNRILNPAEVWQNAIAQCQDAILRGYSIVCPNDQPSGTNGATDTGNRLVTDGDSITAGTGTSPAWPSILTLNAVYNVSDQGIGGANMTNLTPAAPRTVDQFISTNSTQSVVTIWAGTNDNCAPSAASIFANLVQYVLNRKRAGWGRVFPITMIDRNGETACKNSYDALIRAFPWPDGYIDVAGDPNLGADGAGAAGGTTWFQNLGIHPTQYAAYNSVAPIIQARINEEYANTQLASATVYASAAAAAVATTAGSEATNTVTITMAATPANCQVGSTAVVAGVTPAGYNSANGEGWTIITRSATQITYFNVSGLGAITVQGTVSCPQQQETDVVEVLNFGAGNHTLQSCQKFLGLHANNGFVTIRNINAAGSTLVPFGSETIVGSGTTTLAAGTTALLQAQLVSSAASGCNWSRVQ